MLGGYERWSWTKPFCSGDWSNLQYKGENTISINNLYLKNGFEERCSVSGSIIEFIWIFSKVIARFTVQRTDDDSVQLHTYNQSIKNVFDEQSCYQNILSFFIFYVKIFSFFVCYWERQALVFTPIPRR